MKAIICGAGIAGLTSAWWLKRIGWDVLLVEPGLRIYEGCMIDFFGRGGKIVQQMELMPKLNEICCRIPQIVWIDLEHNELASLSFFRLEALLGEQLLILARNDLARVLLDSLPADIEVRFGRAVAAIQFEENGVTVDLSDNCSEQADILIGADGVRSRVRDLVFGALPRYMRSLGFQVAGFTVQDHALIRKLGCDMQLIAAPAREVGLCPLQGGRIAASFVHRIPGTHSGADSIDELKCLYRDFGSLVSAILDSAPGTHFHYDQALQVDLPHWHRNRVVLLGDACHAGSLSAGQGASFAMAAARTLSGCLSSEKTIDAALESYERRLKPTLDQGQATRRRMAKWLAPRTEGQILTRAALLRLAGLPWVGPLLKGMVLSGIGSASLQG